MLARVELQIPHRRGSHETHKAPPRKDVSAVKHKTDYAPKTSGLEDEQWCM